METSSVVSTLITEDSRLFGTLGRPLPHAATIRISPDDDGRGRPSWRYTAPVVMQHGEGGRRTCGFLILLSRRVHAVSIPDFNATGNLPPGRHSASLDELRSALVAPFEGSATRSGIFEWWRHHRDALLDLIEIQSQWLGGSFTSDKMDPNDVDMVTVLDGPRFDEMPRHRQLMVQMLIAGNYTEEFWMCDVYPVLSYPSAHPGHNASVIAAQRWETHFGRDRNGNERGFVEVLG